MENNQSDGYLRYYIRDANRTPIGLLLAKKVEDKIAISWSKCNGKFDQFSKKRAFTIAAGRIKKHKHWCLAKDDVPECIYNAYQKFERMVIKYFKVNKDAIRAT